MLSDYKYIFGNIDHAFLLNVIPLFLFFIFFCAVLLIVWLRPTNEYEEARMTPLDED